MWLSAFTDLLSLDANASRKLDAAMQLHGQDTPKLTICIQLMKAKKSVTLGFKFVSFENMGLLAILLLSVTRKVILTTPV